MGQNKYPDFRVRIPPELKEKIKESAEKNNRSMNADIVLRLERSFAQDEGDDIIAFDKGWLDKNKIDADKMAEALLYVLNKAKEIDEKNKSD